MDIDEEQFVFNIPDQNWPTLQAKLEKISKKAQKMGLPEVFVMVIGYKDEKNDKNMEHRVWEVMISGYTPKIDGWEFAAKIDFTRDNGNIIQTSPGHSIPHHYHSVDSICEHCNHKRRRTNGYVLKNSETGEYKIVGSSCVSDFFDGNNPVNVGKYFEILRAFRKNIHGYTVDNYTPADYRNLNVQGFVSCTLESIEKWGWYSATSARQAGKHYASTAAKSLDLYVSSEYGNLVMIHLEQSGHIIEWAKNLSDEEISGNNFLGNIRVLAKDGIAGMDDVNMLAGMVKAYMNEHTAKTVKPVINSGHQGTIGEKITVNDVVVHKMFPSFDKTKVVIKFIDNSGNIFTWFNHGVNSLKLDQKTNITGKIVAHNTYNGVNETVLTRVSTK